jgi:hypothetical protein
LCIGCHNIVLKKFVHQYKQQIVVLTLGKIGRLQFFSWIFWSGFDVVVFVENFSL